MTRTLSGAMVTHLASGTTTLAGCARLDLSDGTSLCVTDHDRPLSLDLGDGAAAYDPDTGLAVGAITLTVGLEADICEIRGPIGEVVTLADVLGGRYRRARVRLFEVNWASPTHLIRWLGGKITEARVEGGEYVFEVRSHADAFNQTIGGVLTPYCKREFGQGLCTKVRETFPAEVVAVTDAMTFTVSFTGDTPEATDILAGEVEWTSGGLVGVPKLEVFSFAAGVVTLYGPLLRPPAIGDQLTIFEGCDKIFTTCRDKGQIKNFKGWPWAPGTPNYLKYGVPGQ